MSKKININIEGMHCRSCKTLIESDVKVLKGVKSIDTDYQTGECDIEFDVEKISEKEIFEIIENLNYKVIKDKTDKINNAVSYGNLIKGAILVLLFFFGYLAVKNSGSFEILSKLNEGNLGYSLIFIIGILASFHCVGMCGGLVVAYTAIGQKSKVKSQKTSDDEASPHTPHLQYNLGRFISYTLVGAVLGGLGSFFGINPVFTGIVTLVAGALMVLMGLSLITNFGWLKKIKIKTPEFIAKFLYNNKHSKNPKGPFVIGLLTGFMPCGPLQAMQVYALASGSIMTGALSMGAYALGTVPLMFGFGSFLTFISQERIKQIMKASGVIVAILGVFMLNRGLANFGYGASGFVSSPNIVTTDDIKKSGDYQTIEMDVTYRGYQPNVLYIKKDVPVRWVINDKGITGCTNEIFLYHEDGIIKQKLNLKGDTVIEFTPTKLGEIKFSCWMRMVWGKFIVQ